MRKKNIFCLNKNVPTQRWVWAYGAFPWEALPNPGRVQPAPRVPAVSPVRWAATWSSFGLWFPVSSACPGCCRSSGAPLVLRDRPELERSRSTLPPRPADPTGCSVPSDAWSRSAAEPPHPRDVAGALSCVLGRALRGMAAGLFFGNPFSCQKGRAQPCPFVPPVSALPWGRGTLLAQPSWLSPRSSVLPEDVLEKAVAGRELLAPGRLLVIGRLVEAAAGLCGRSLWMVLAALQRPSLPSALLAHALLLPW